MTYSKSNPSRLYSVFRAWMDDTRAAALSYPPSGIIEEKYWDPFRPPIDNTTLTCCSIHR